MLQKYKYNFITTTPTTYEHTHTHTESPWPGVWWLKPTFDFLMECHQLLQKSHMILIRVNCWQQWFSWKFSGWLKEIAWLVHVLLQKWISSKSSPSPAQSNFHRWYFVPLWFLKWHTKAQSYSWLKLTGAPWMALVALRIQWWQAHTKYRHFQPIWTQSQHWTPICTLIDCSSIC